MDVLYDNSKLGKKYFKMYVRDLDGNIIGIGTGSSKQKGEKIAAKKALQNLNVIPNDNEDEILDQESSIIFHRNLGKNEIKKKLSKVNPENHLESGYESETKIKKLKKNKKSNNLENLENLENLKQRKKSSKLSSQPDPTEYNNLVQVPIKKSKKIITSNDKIFYSGSKEPMILN